MLLFKLLMSWAASAAFGLDEKQIMAGVKNVAFNPPFYCFFIICEVIIKSQNTQKDDQHSFLQ